MVRLIDVDERIVEHLHWKVSDPKSRISSTTENFTATAGQTRFTLTPPSGSMLYVSSVTVQTVSQVKYEQYDFDLVNKQIILATGATLDDAVSVTYGYGTAWIFDNLPLPNLNQTNYPRIAVQWIAKPTERAGMGGDTSLDHPLLQIDALHHKMERITAWDIDGNTMNLQAKPVVRILRRRIIAALKNDWRGNLGYDINAPTIKEDHPVPYEEARDVFRHMLSFSFVGEDMGDGVIS